MLSSEFSVIPPTSPSAVLKSATLVVAKPESQSTHSSALYHRISLKRFDIDVQLLSFLAKKSKQGIQFFLGLFPSPRLENQYHPSSDRRIYRLL